MFASIQIIERCKKSVIGYAVNMVCTLSQLSNDKDCPFVIWVGSHRKIKREAFEKFLMNRQSA